MMKLLRKHNKKLLAVFMALLLIVWLGGTALETLLNPNTGKYVLADSQLGEIREQDRMVAQQQTTILQTMGFPWSNPHQSTAIASGQKDPLSYFDWILLTREAQKMGIQTRIDQAEAFLTGQGLTRDHVNRMALRLNVTPERLYGAVSEFLSVLKAADVVASAAQMSEAEIRVRARNANEKVDVELIALSAESFRDESQTFSEEQMQEQFDKYRDQPRGEGLTFGYFLPPQVKVQYVKIDLDMIKSSLRAPESTIERRAREFWRENKENPQFLRPRDEATAEQDDPATPKTRYYESYAEARDAAMNYVRGELARESAAQLADFIIQRAAEMWISDTGDDGFKKLPAGADDEQLYARVVSEAPAAIAYEGAATVATTDWFSRDEALGVPVVGGARLIAPGSPSLSLDRLAFQVQGLVVVPENENIDRSLYLALHETSSSPLRDNDGNYFVFRVVDVRTGQAPEHLDEVRGEVIADLRLRQGYQKAIEEGERLLEAARDLGLKAAWDAASDLQDKQLAGAGYYDPRPFAREFAAFRGFTIPVTVEGIGQADEVFLDACFALGEQDKFASIPMEDKAMVAVVNWQALNPMVRDRYPQLRRNVIQQAQLMRQQQAILDWLDPDLIESRHRLEMREQS